MIIVLSNSIAFSQDTCDVFKLDNPQNLSTNEGTQWLELPSNFSLDVRYQKAEVYFDMKVEDLEDIAESVVEFRLTAFNESQEVPNIFQNSSYKLTIDNDKRENRLRLDIIDFVIDNSLPFNRISVEVINFSGQNVQFLTNYNFKLGFDVTDAKTQIKNLKIKQETQEVEFSWEDTFPVNNYQIEVVKLENKFQNFAVKETSVKTIVEWKNALIFNISADVQDDNGSITKTTSFSLGQGTGFYVFRVRPIGNFHGGGVVNENNFGLWTEGPENETIVELDLESDEYPSLPYFYFQDVDENKNWIYSRTFTEGGKIRENIVYANSLLQPRQQTTYIPSQNISIITHTILDNTGRPTLVTLPTPVEGKRLSYAENFALSNETNDLYSAIDFDEDGNFEDPAKMKGISYYDGSNSLIPDAEGFPYTRTLYYNDGTGRVKEQSGVGETFKAGSGKTTRYYYSTASESELIAMFGKEAPNNESVSKIITVDPNNVVSISYKNMEGNVIATAMTFLENQNDSDNMSIPDSESINTMQVVDKITSNSRIENGFTSSKKVTISNDGTSFNLSYKIRCEQLESLCYSNNIDCNYVVDFKIYKVDDFTNELINEYTNVELSNCQVIEGEDEQFKITENPIDMVLNSGTYVIQKVLKPTNIESSVSSNGEQINNQIAPITEMISGWLEGVETPNMLQNYFNSLENLKNAINNQDLENFTNQNSVDFPVDIPSEFFSSIYNTYYNEEQEVYFRDLYYMELVRANNGNVVGINFVTPCCSEMSIPVNWTPPFDCNIDDKDNNGVVDYDETPDFEQYAFDLLSDVIDEETMYSDYMTGWERGVLNKMIHHMLIDEYEGTNTTASDIENGLLPNRVQYTCEELFDCWEGAILNLKNQFVNDINNGGEGGVNISEEFDDQYENDESDDKYGKDHDSHFDDNYKPTGILKGLKKWVVKRKISKVLREEQSGTDGNVTPEPPSMHLIKTFLDCTGLKFAKVNTVVDAKPISQDILSGFAYINDAPDNAPISLSFNTVTQLDYFTTSNYQQNGKLKYVPLSDWTPESLNGKRLFKYIKNPVFAFKYFEYENYGEYQDLEQQTCFVDPNDCFQMEDGKIKLDANNNPVIIPCCEGDNCYTDSDYPATNASKSIVNNFCGVGRVKCESYYDEWTSEQLFTFYKMYLGYNPTEIELEEDFDVTCEDFVNENEWYELINLSENLPLLVNGNTYSNYDQTTKSYFAPLTFDKDGQTLTTFSMVEKEMSSFISQCESGCESKRSEIRKKIYDVLNEKCYVIGECRTEDENTSHIVPESDIDLMVDAVVEQCLTQCNLTTFSCDTWNCRDINTPYTETGVTTNSSTMEFGMGGHPDPSTVSKDDNVSSYYVNVDFDGDGNNDARRYTVPEDGGNFSWFEYTLLKQVEEWELKLDLPTKCADDTDESVAVSNNTFVPKESYEVNKQGLDVVNSVIFTEPIISPTINIEINAGQE